MSDEKLGQQIFHLSEMMYLSAQKDNNSAEFLINTDLGKLVLQLKNSNVLITPLLWVRISIRKTYRGQVWHRKPAYEIVISQPLEFSYQAESVLRKKLTIDDHGTGAYESYIDDSHRVGEVMLYTSSEDVIEELTEPILHSFFVILNFSWRD